MGRRSLLGVIVGVAALTAAGCAGDDGANGALGADTGAGDAQLSVVATTTQLTDFTRNVAGDRAEVTGILQPNVDAHDFDPTPADIEAIAEAEVLVTNGVDLEAWLDDAIDASGFDGLRVDTSEGVTLLAGPEDLHAEDDHADEAAEDGHAEAEDDDHDHAEDEGAEDGHADEDGEGAEEPDAAEAEDAATDEDHADEDGGHDDEDGHDHGEFDPHIWQDPQNAEIMVGNIADALAEADSEGADTYQASADDYVEQLQELDAEVAEQLEQLDNRLLVTNHEAFTYYAARYDLEFVGSIIPSFATQAELSTQEVDELVAEIRATGVKAVFSETSLPPETAETIAGEAGVEVVTGDDALYGDSLGPEGSPGATYTDAIRHNTETIVEHLG